MRFDLFQRFPFCFRQKNRGRNEVNSHEHEKRDRDPHSAALAGQGSDQRIVDSERGPARGVKIAKGIRKERVRHQKL